MCDILYNQILLTEYNWSFFSVKALLLVCWPFCLLMGFLSGYLSWIYWFLCLTMASAAQNQEGVPEILRKQLAVAVRSIQWSYAIFWSLSAAQQGYIIFIFFFFFSFFKYFISTVQYLLVQFCSSFNFYIQFWFLESTNAIFLVKFAIFDTYNSLIYTAILEERAHIFTFVLPNF